MARRHAPICVLGMHRSGTSCLTGSLEQAGLYLGEVRQASRRNLKGNRENVAVQHLNDAVLAHNGGSWDVVPDQLAWTPAHAATRDTLIADLASHDLWGFKDPRCLLTLPFWQDALPDMRMVATVRHPLPVARSLMQRKVLLPKTPPLQLWLDYNRRLLALCTAHDIPLVCFDWAPDRYLEALQTIARQLGLAASLSEAPFFEAGLVHETRDAEADTLAKDALFQDALDVYAALQARTLPPSDPSTAPMRPRVPAKGAAPAPKLSVVVNFHKMRREAARTLHALSPAYQRHVAAENYEVIAVENGSAELDPDWVRSFGPNIRFLHHDTTSHSPVEGINRAAALARGTHIATIVDGARIPTPGIVATSLQALTACRPCFVASLAFHLGSEVQWKAMQTGYDKATEDALLAQVDWRADGYRLFDVATLAPSSRWGFLNGLPKECSWIAMPRARFNRLGGYHPGYTSLGGGLMNHDLLARVQAIPDMTPVVLLGEATFHQIHGGTSTESQGEARKQRMKLYRAEFQAIRGTPVDLETSSSECTYFGTLPAQAIPFVRTLTR